MTPGVFSGLISGLTGLVSGIVVALANHWLTKRKTAAEIEKLQAEAELTRAQAKQITDNFSNLSDKVSYKLPDVAHSNETILYNSDNSDAFDLRVVKVDHAEGEFTVKDGILYINRTNTVGSLQIWLEKLPLCRKAPSEGTAQEREHFWRQEAARFL
jgi:hypothetical protein